MHRCDYFIQQADQEVECRLCPHFCKIKAGHSGICHRSEERRVGKEC